MVKRTAFLMWAIMGMTVAGYAIEPPASFDLTGVSSMPVLEGGRFKPFESFAGKVMQEITGRWNFRDGDPVAYVLSMMTFDDWMNEEMILVDYQPLKDLLGLNPSQKYFSFNTLIASPELQRVHQRLGQKMEMQQDLTRLENRAGELIHRLTLFQGIVSGEEVTLVPPPPGSDPRESWLPITHPHGYSDEKQNEIHNRFEALLTAVRQSDAEAFVEAGAALKQELASLNPELIPAASSLQREITYNHIRPFLLSWILYLLAFLVFLVSFSFEHKTWRWAGYTLYSLGYLLNTYGLLVRCFIAGRAPVSNMYESVVFVGWGVLTFALIFELVYRQRWFMTVASLIGVGLLVMADLMPFDANIEPLQPVLRSNYWLIIHVMTITLSYSAFALATGLAHVVLGIAFFKGSNRPLVRTLSNFLYRVLQVGTVMIAAGTILGGVWAAESWGRFWGWDPKETWALISLLGYMTILHARFIRWLKMIGTAVASILGFWLIIMTWYGVNFVLGKGLHSYGFGAGGGWYVIGFMLFEIAYLTTFAIRYYANQAAPAVPIAPGKPA